MAAYLRVYDSPAGLLPRSGISSGTLRSVFEYELPLIFYVIITLKYILNLFRLSYSNNKKVDVLGFFGGIQVDTLDYRPVYRV